MTEKEVKELTLEDIKENLEKYKDKKAYIKRILPDVDPKIKSEVRKKLIKIIKDEAVNYYLAYDSVSEGLEPIYYWILDFMRDTSPSGLDLDVTKTSELVEASASSGYFGEIGSRATVMQQRATEMLKQINTVVRSILNLVYDLKEFRVRLDLYDKLKSHNKLEKEDASYAVKSVWMDQVDVKKGLASINQLAQKLNFVTLRDAFMQVNTEEEADKLDLNDRVKRILKRKLIEYLAWVKYSEQELNKRYKIERAYLKSQIDSLKLYTSWTKPYLKAAQKLNMTEFNKPDIVNAFSNMQMQLSLTGQKEIKPEDVHESFRKKEFEERKFYAIIDVELNFRAIPQSVRTERGQQYVHGGRADIYIKGYSVDSEELEIIKEQELHEDAELVDNLTNVSLKELEEDINEIMKEPEKEDEEKEKEKKIVKKTVKESYEDIKDDIKDFFEPFKGIIRTPTNYVEDEIRKFAKEKAEGSAFTLYDIYKKAHGMLSW